MPARLPYHTIGHSTLSVDELAARLKAAKVTRLIDVRTIPRSRTNPQFNQDVLPAALAPHGIAGQLYQMVHARGVGGNADAALAGVRDEAPHAAEETVEIAGNTACRILSGQADIMGKIGLSVGDGRDVTVDLVQRLVISEQPHLCLLCLFGGGARPAVAGD